MDLEDLAKVPEGEAEPISKDKSLGIDRVIEAAEAEGETTRLLTEIIPIKLRIINNINTKPGRRANGRIEKPLALRCGLAKIDLVFVK